MDDFRAAGVDVTAIGTGGKRYAKAFVAEEQVPFPVLLDEEGEAAAIVGTNTIGTTTLLKPGAVKAGIDAWRGGHRQRKTGRRPMQLGATIVMGPGDAILFADFEDHPGDHADIDAVLTAATASR